jgi:hypothetical protein
MKSFLNAIYKIMKSMGRAKAAAYLARHGHVEQAKALMLAD